MQGVIFYKDGFFAVKNKKDFLEKEVKKMAKISDNELLEMAKKSREEREKIEMKKDKMTKQKYWVT